MDREKVIKALEFCLMPPSREELENDICSHEDCPYYREYNGGKCVSAVAKDALALLKAQEPRILTVSEIGALANGDVVWVEFTDGRLLPMMVEDGCLMRWRFLWRICEDAFYDENYKARAWTSRPDQATREATSWNE